MVTKYPQIWSLENLIKHMKDGEGAKIDTGEWVPARPEGYSSFISRIKCAWLVFRGKADALIWPGQ